MNRWFPLANNQVNSSMMVDDNRDNWHRKRDESEFLANCLLGRKSIDSQSTFQHCHTKRVNLNIDVECFLIFICWLFSNGTEKLEQLNSI